MNISFELLNKNDKHLNQLMTLYDIPAIRRFISVSDNFFEYIINTDNVYLLKILNGECLIGNVHFEIVHNVMYLSVIVTPKLQRQGIGKVAVNYVMEKFKCKKYCVGIEKDNVASIKLFESLGFKFQNFEDGILNYTKEKGE